MANPRRSLSPLQGMAPADRSRPRRGIGRWPLIACAVLVVVLALAWFDGGEEPLHPIAEPVDLLEQTQ